MVRGAFDFLPRACFDGLFFWGSGVRFKEDFMMIAKSVGPRRTGKLIFLMMSIGEVRVL